MTSIPPVVKEIELSLLDNANTLYSNTANSFHRS